MKGPLRRAKGWPWTPCTFPKPHSPQSGRRVQGDPPSPQQFVQLPPCAVTPRLGCTEPFHWLVLGGTSTSGLSFRPGLADPKGVNPSWARLIPFQPKGKLNAQEAPRRKGPAGLRTPARRPPPCPATQEPRSVTVRGGN